MLKEDAAVSLSTMWAPPAAGIVIATGGSLSEIHRLVARPGVVVIGAEKLIDCTPAAGAVPVVAAWPAIAVPFAVA
jgi:hypothetical protein